jgi:hypothetical protein
MGNLAVFLLLAYLTWGGASTLVDTGFPAHTTQPNPGVSPNFQEPYYQTMAYGPNIPPICTGVPYRGSQHSCPEKTSLCNT